MTTLITPSENQKLEKLRTDREKATRAANELEADVAHRTGEFHSLCERIVAHAAHAKLAQTTADQVPVKIEEYVGFARNVFGQRTGEYERILGEAAKLSAAKPFYDLIAAEHAKAFAEAVVAAKEKAASLNIAKEHWPPAMLD